MYIKVSSLVRILLVVVVFAFILAAMLFTVGGLLSAHHSIMSDRFIYAGVAVGVIMIIAIVDVLAIWAVQVSKYVVIISYVIYVWLLMTIFGNKALKKKHPNVQHAQ
ncbi:MAG: hypothetical protein NTV39_04080 [Candidatus Saccharibacteria bacterium]|nr:hypothetical protein [Candidatus Saccharibacteria bacterium]